MDLIHEQELKEEFSIYTGCKMGHDNICYHLGGVLLSNEYEVIYMYEYYKDCINNYKINVRDIAGEVDIIAVKDDKEIYFEVKGRYTSNGAKKAKKQLMRHLDYLNPEALTYEVYGNSEGYKAYRFDSNGR